MSINIDTIKSALGNVIDPDLNKSLNELDAVKNVKIDSTTIKIELELPQPINWVAGKINDLCIKKLKDIAPDYISEINISEKPFTIPDRSFLHHVKNIIAVASGKGGVGKSAVASNIAAALSLKGARVGILDGDVYGPSIPTMFGLANESLKAYEYPDGKVMAEPHEKYGIKVASMGFILNKNEAAIIRGPMLAGYFSMLFEQIEWGQLDFLVFDLPPGTGDIQLTLTQRIPLSGALIVTTPQEIALSDVRRSIAMFRKVNVDILGIVENMSYFIPPDNPSQKYFIFGEGGGRSVAEEHGLELLGEIPLDIAIRTGNDGGMPVVLNENLSKQAAYYIEATENLISSLRRLNFQKSSDGNDLEINI